MGRTHAVFLSIAKFLVVSLRARNTKHDEHKNKYNIFKTSKLNFKKFLNVFKVRPKKKIRENHFYNDAHLIYFSVLSSLFLYISKLIIL